MNRLSLDKRAKIIQLIVEGNSLRSCSRIADVSITTVSKLLVDVGRACLKFHSQTAIRIRCKRVQCDEIWSFVYCKDKNVVDEKYGIGSVWTWVAIDADSKFVISWFAGERTLEAATFFMNDLWCRLRTRVQLTTDGYKGYQEAVADTFGRNVDFAQLVKQYNEREHYIGARRIPIAGKPDKKYITTSHVERQNLTMRMCIRRFGRKTNAFSKKMDNHCYAIALHFVHYNFCRIHTSLRVTPAMQIKVAEKPMTYKDIALLVEKYLK